MSNAAPQPAVTGAEFAAWLAGAPHAAIDGRPEGARLNVAGPVRCSSVDTLRVRTLARFDFDDDVDLSSAEFGVKLEVVDCRFDGRFALDGARVSGSLTLRALTLNADRNRIGSKAVVSLADARIGGSLIVEDFATADSVVALTMERAQIGARLSLTGRDGGRYGNIVGTGVVVGGDIDIAGRATKASGFDFSGGSVGGALTIRGGGGGALGLGYVVCARARIHGGVTVADVDVRGAISFHGADIRGQLELGRSLGPGSALTIAQGLDLSNAQIGGNVRIVGGTFGNKFNLSSHGLGLRNAILSGDFHLASVTDTGDGLLTIHGDLDASSARFQGTVWLRGVTITGGANFNWAELIGGMFVDPQGSLRTEVAKDVQLSSLRGKPWIRLKAIRIGGDLRILGSEITVLQVGLGCLVEGRDGDIEVVASRVGRFSMEGSHVHGWVSMPFIQVDGTVGDNDVRGFYIRNSTIDGDLDLWSATAFASATSDAQIGNPPRFDAWRYSGAVIGPVTIVNCTINGAVDLSFLKASEELSLEGTKIRGHLHLRSTVTVAGDLEDEQRLAALACPAMDPLLRASLRHAAIRRLTVENDVDLTGLSVFEQPGVRKCGSIDAAHLTVIGDIRACARHQGAEVFVEVPGQLEFRHISAGGLDLSLNSFVGLSSKTDPEDDLVLADSKIDRVWLARPRSQEGGLGCWVSLDGLQVTSWSIGAQDAHVAHESFRDLLQADRSFRRSSYKAIEAYLRNRGEDGPADFIYREMWRRELRESTDSKGLLTRYGQRGMDRVATLVSWPVRLSRPIWRAIASEVGLAGWWLYGVLLRFGTSPMRLAAVILLLAVLSYPIYRHPLNVQPSLQRLAVQTEREGPDALDHCPAIVGRSPREECWSSRDALALLTRYHIPVVATSLRDDWSMRDDARTIYDPAAFIWSMPLCVSASDRPAAPIAGEPVPNAEAVRTCGKGVAVSLPLPPEDVASGLMIANFAMWPLLLAFMLRRLLRL